MGLGKHLPDELFEKQPDVNTPESPEDSPIDLEDGGTQEDDKEVRNMERIIMEATDFMAMVSTLKLEEVSRENMVKIMSGNNKFLRELIMAAPLLDDDGKYIDLLGMFNFYKDSGDIFGEQWRLFYRLAGFASSDFGWGKGTLAKDLKAEKDALTKDKKDWKTEVKPILEQTTVIPKTGGGTWTMKNGVTLLDFAVRNNAVGTATGSRSSIAEKKAKELKETIQKAEAEMLANMSWWDIIRGRAAKTNTFLKKAVIQGSIVGSKVNLRAKKLVK